MWYEGKNALFVDGPNFGQVTKLRIGSEGKAPTEFAIPVYYNLHTLRFSDSDISIPKYVEPETKWYTLLSGLYPFVHCYSVARIPTEETYRSAIRLIEILVAEDFATTTAKIAKSFEERIKLLDNRFSTLDARLSAIVSNHRLQDSVTEDYEEDYE